MGNFVIASVLYLSRFLTAEEEEEEMWNSIERAFSYPFNLMGIVGIFMIIIGLYQKNKVLRNYLFVIGGLLSITLLIGLLGLIYHILNYLALFALIIAGAAYLLKKLNKS